MSGVGQANVLDVLGDGAFERGHHGVDAAICGLDDDVVEVIDEVGVVAVAADHDVAADAAVERVVAEAADQGLRTGSAFK